MKGTPDSGLKFPAGRTQRRQRQLPRVTLGPGAKAWAAGSWMDSEAPGDPQVGEGLRTSAPHPASHLLTCFRAEPAFHGPGGCWDFQVAPGRPWGDLECSTH